MDKTEALLTGAFKIVYNLTWLRLFKCNPAEDGVGAEFLLNEISKLLKYYDS